MDEKLLCTIKGGNQPLSQIARYFARNHFDPPRRALRVIRGRFRVESHPETYRLVLMDEISRVHGVLQEANPDDDDPHPLD